MGDTEVLLTSSLGSSASSVNLWNFRCGTFLGSYQSEGILGVNSIALCGGFIIASEKSKSLLYSWQLNKQKNNSVRFLCPRNVTSLDCSPDSNYLIVGVEQNLHLYQICSGKLLSIGSKHFQPLVIVRFNNDGTFIGCGGEDGMVSVWNLSSLASKPNCSEPLHAFSSHSLPVNDIKFTSGGQRARIISVSGDRSCKIHEISSGNLLLTLLFDGRLTSLTLPLTERLLFIGNGDGGIHKIILHNPPRQKSHYCDRTDNSKLLSGHSKAVTCLCCSMDSVLLLSGSQDESVKIWHVVSGHCLRTIPHCGAVTNLIVFIPPRNMFSHDFSASVKLQNLCISTNSEENFKIEIKVNHDLGEHCGSQLVDTKEDSRECEIDKLLKINNHIYKYALEKILTKN